MRKVTKGMLLELEEYRKDASAAEKKLIDMLLKNPDQVIGKSIHQLSEMVYASPATIIRLCKKLGCSGYREFPLLKGVEQGFRRGLFCEGQSRLRRRRAGHRASCTLDYGRPSQ